MIEIRIINSVFTVKIVTDFCLRFTQKIKSSMNLKVKSDTDCLSSLSEIKSKLK